jgi:hypothetical protein
MKSIAAIAGIGLLVGMAAVANAQRPAAPAMEVYKSPTCGCCSKWVEHVRQAGFTVKVTEMDDQALADLKTKQGVPRTAQSCHTGLVGGYVVEGHVPAAEISRLLKEKPAIQGIAVGGMPTGSPGMEGGRPEVYEVMLFGDSPPVGFGRYLGDKPA